MRITNLFVSLLMVMGLALVAGCSSDGTSRTQLGTVRIHLTDAPGDFEEVNLVVTGVSVRRADLEEGGWETLSHESNTYDLLELQNGVLVLLAVGEVPAGHYDEIRLLLGEGSTVVVDGVSHPLTVPSGMSSGYKLKGAFDVDEGEETDLTLDFDAARSIHQTGNGRYMLRPTVRLIVGDVVVTTGRIAGRLLPEGADATLYAILDDDTLQTTSPEADGSFTLAALIAGSYDVAIDAEASFRDTTLSGVEVNVGETTDVGDVQLELAAAAAAVASGSTLRP